jgi:uncharacterized protein
MPDLHELDVDECERLLRSQRFGRLGLQTPTGPTIVPVNYAVHDRSVVVRVAADGLVARFAHGSRLVFEVDVVDHERWSGWSVTVEGVGELRAVDTAEERVPSARPRPWADGARDVELRLGWTDLRGRRVGR